MCDFEITGIEGLRAEGVAHCTDCGPGRCDCDSGFYIYKYIYININVLDRAALCCMTEWTSGAAQQQQHRCNKYRDTE